MTSNIQSAFHRQSMRIHATILFVARSSSSAFSLEPSRIGPLYRTLERFARLCRANGIFHRFAYLPEFLISLFRRPSALQFHRRAPLVGTLTSPLSECCRRRVGTARAVSHGRRRINLQEVLRSHPLLLVQKRGGVDRHRCLLERSLSLCS